MRPRPLATAITCYHGRPARHLSRLGCVGRAARKCGIGPLSASLPPLARTAPGPADQYVPRRRVVRLLLVRPRAQHWGLFPWPAPGGPADQYVTVPPRRRRRVVRVRLPQLLRARPRAYTVTVTTGGPARGPGRRGARAAAHARMGSWAGGDASVVRPFPSHCHGPGPDSHRLGKF